MTLNDRFVQGLIAGICGGISSLAWGMFSRYVLRFTTMLYADFAAALVYGQKAANLPEKLFSHFVVFMFFGLDGILFAFLLKAINRKNLLLKGLFWGGLIWFISYVITLLFKVPGLLKVPFRTAVSQLIGGLIWGATTALVLNYLEDKVPAA